MEEAGELTPETGKALDDLNSRLKLHPIRRKRRWWYWVDVSFRFTAVLAGFIFFGLLAPAPIMILRWIDNLLIRLGLTDPFHQLSEFIKRFIAGTWNSFSICSLCLWSSLLPHSGGNISRGRRPPPRVFQGELCDPHFHSCF